jgi:autotransporter-like protein
MPKPLFLALLVLLMALAVGGVRGQDLDTRSLESGYARLVSFEAQPEISAARLTVDSDDSNASDLDIDTAKVPLYREFPLAGGEKRWFLQATGSYLSMNETLGIELSADFTEELELDWTGYGALVEAGLVFPLTDSLEIAPSIGLGVTRLENDADFTSSVIEEALAGRLDGILYNWDTLASVVRLSSALRYDREFGTWRIKGSAYLSGSYIDSFDESDRFGGFTDEAANFGMSLDASHPLAWKVRDYPVFIIGHLGLTQFLGADRDALGFSSFGEAGVSLGIQRFTLGVLGAIGGDVRGWNLLFNYDY